MYYLKVKALGLNYFNNISNNLNAENIDHNISYDHTLRGDMYSFNAKREHANVEQEFWGCYGYNENRLAITQLADSYFPKNEHSFACNIAFPHALIKYNSFKEGYVESFLEYVKSYGLGSNYYKTVWEGFGKTNIFSTLTIPIDSPLQYGKYQQILQQNKIQGVVCYGKKLKTKVYCGFGDTPKGFVFYTYGVGQYAPIIESLAKIYFDNFTSLRINNLPNNHFCIPYNDLVKGHVSGFDEILIRSGVTLITK